MWPIESMYSFSPYSKPNTGSTVAGGGAHSPDGLDTIIPCPKSNVEKEDSHAMD